MKCIFCEAEILPGKDKCDYCGRYQHDMQVKKEDNKENEKSKYQSVESILRRRKKIYNTISMIIITLIIVGVGGYFLIKYLNSQYPFLGKWNCNGGDLFLEIDSSSIKMNYDSSGYQEAEYLIDTKEKSISYVLNVSSVKKLINGSTFVDNSNTRFQIDIDKEDSSKMILKNLTTDKEYNCYKN